MLQIKQEIIIEIRMGFDLELKWIDYILFLKLKLKYLFISITTYYFNVIIGSEKKSAFIIPVGQILSS